MTSTTPWRASGSLDLIEVRLAQGRTNGLQRYIDAALDSVKRASALTHRLLAFSRRQPLDPKRTNVGELLTYVDELFAHTNAVVAGALLNDGMEVMRKPFAMNAFQSKVERMMVGSFTLKAADYRLVRRPPQPKVRTHNQ